MLSIVVPLLNEEASLDKLVQAIDRVSHENEISVEMILVDDGSTDQSWIKIQQLAARDPRVRGVRFRRNFGKAAALSAAFQIVKGNHVVTMDADLQDDPAEIPHLLAKLDQGYDVVSGWKKVRHDPWHKVWPSYFFNSMVSFLTGVHLHDHNCGLKAYRREVLDEVKLYGEMHRFIPVLAAARGWRVTEIPVAHRSREFGRSKYGFTRFFKGFLDLLTVYFLTGFRQRPQHLLGTLGLISFSFGSLVLIILSLTWCLTRVIPGWEPLHLHERAIFFFAILGLLLGIQLISIGFLAELITANARPHIATYSIVETLGVDEHSQIR